jgi:hypothetical protein
MKQYQILLVLISFAFFTSCTHPVKEVYVNIITNHALESTSLKDLGSLKDIITPFQTINDTTIIFRTNIIRTDIDTSTGLISFDSPMKGLNNFITGKQKDGKKEEKAMNKAIENNTYPCLKMPTNDNYIYDTILFKSMNPNLYIFTDSVFKYTVNGIAKTTFNNPNLLKREIEKKYVAKKINDTIYIFYDPKKTSKEFEIVFRELKPKEPSIPPQAPPTPIAEPTPIVPKVEPQKKVEPKKSKSSSSSTRKPNIKPNEELADKGMVVPPYKIKK